MSEKSEKKEFYDPDYPPLKGKVGEAAVNGQIFQYPHVVRNDADPPILNQESCILSFNLLDQPRRYKGKFIYGYVKFRGAHANHDYSTSAAKRIIKETDSKFKTLIAPSGKWVPITDINDVVKEMIDVKTEEHEKQGIENLHGEVAAEKRREAERRRKEIEEAVEQLKNNPDVYDNPEGIDWYITKRNTEKKLRETVELKRRELDTIESQLLETRVFVKLIEEVHPEYDKDWLAKFNLVREKSGISAFVPAEDEFEELEALNLEDLRKEHPDVVKEAEKKIGIYIKSVKDAEKEEEEKKKAKDAAKAK